MSCLRIRLLMVTLVPAIFSATVNVPLMAQTIALESNTIDDRLNSHSDTLEDNSYYNRHTFEGKAGEQITIELTSDEFDPYLLLIDPEGNKIAEDDDSGEGKNARITLTLPSAGTYVIWANSYGERETGNYTLSWREASPSDLFQAEVIQLSLQGIEQLQRSQFRAALESWQEAIGIYRQLGDRQGEASSLGNLGNAYHGLGQYEKAIELHQQSLVLFQKLGDRPGEASSLGNLGSAYHSLGQYEKAVELHQQSLALFRELKDLQGEASSLGSLGITYRSLGQHEKAMEFYQQSLALFRELKDLQGEANSLGNLGSIYGTLGQYEKAIESHQQSLAIKRELRDRRGEANSLGNLGSIYGTLGQYEKAIELYQQSLALARELGYRRGEASSLGNLGIIYGTLGQYEKAIELHQQAIGAIESIQGDIKVEELKASYASQQVDLYEGLIILLWSQGDFETAFNYVERARARAFLDQLANGGVDFRAGADSTLLEQEQALKTQIVALSQQLITLRNRPKNEWDNETITQIENKRTALQEDYQDLLVQLKIQSPETANLISVDVAPLAEIQGSLDADTTLVEYFVTDDLTLAFIITHDSFKTVPLNISREQLTEEITLFRDFADLDEPHPLSLKNLHDWLIAPLQPHLNTTQLSIIPHGILHYLPFAALTDGNRYLSDDYALSSLPSASILRYLPEKRKSTTGNLLALGDPDIPGLSPLDYAEDEVKAIAPLFNTQPLLGKAATESTVWAEASQSGIVHLAVHGEYNLYNPLFSAIRLVGDTENDGSLQVHEVYGLDLTNATNLVVLSACQTKIGELSRGDEVVGLNRAFLYAGTPTVMASLWNVDDAATGLLMKQFYTHWQGGMSKAEALQQAQKDVRETHPHPYYWAAFSLTGDARR
jgi:CHAT domain-containing protein/Flp pilus assembly protein TadD